jgi:hypothetical protein
MVAIGLHGRACRHCSPSAFTRCSPRSSGRPIRGPSVARLPSGSSSAPRIPGRKAESRTRHRPLQACSPRTRSFAAPSGRSRTRSGSFSSRRRRRSRRARKASGRCSSPRRRPQSAVRRRQPRTPRPTGRRWNGRWSRCPMPDPVRPRRPGRPRHRLRPGRAGRTRLRRRPRPRDRRPSRPSSRSMRSPPSLGRKRPWHRMRRRPSRPGRP